MAKIEGAFGQIDRRLGRLETELLQMREQIDGLYKEIRSLYRMALSVLIPMWVTIIGAIIGIALTR